MTNGDMRSWSGQLMTTSGRRIRLELKMTGGPGKITGECRCDLVADERIESSTARLEGEWSGADGVTLRLDFGGSAGATLSGTREKLDHHAEEAIYGRYERDGEHGVFIIWRYAEPR